jgi:hypothetical protein
MSRSSKAFVVLALLAVLACGLQTWTLAQSDSATSQVTINNQAVFVTFATPFTTPVTVTNTDVENGFTSVGDATVNVDATSVYDIAATTNFGGSNTAAPGGATFASGKTAFTACQLNLNLAGYVDGDPGPSDSGLAVTTGTSGTDHILGLKLQWTQYTDAPNGAYICHIQVTVTD